MALDHIDASWIAHGKELVDGLREAVTKIDWQRPGERCPTAYLCGADVPGLVAYVDSLKKGAVDVALEDELAAAVKAAGIKPLTPEEANAAYEAAVPVPLSKERIDEIVKLATERPPILEKKP